MGYHQSSTMNIGIIVNTKSGRNKASQFAYECEQLLKSRGHSTHILNTHDQTENDQFWSNDRLIIIGGDGTVHHTLPNLIEHQIPFYHLATGTSNLIATDLNMPKNPAAAVRWIELGGQTHFDIPTFDGRPFLVMCCMGMDAGVIHRFEHFRKGAGGFRNYIRPVLHETLRPRPAHLSINADGIKLDLKSPMNLVIANMRSYALKINPCPEADPADAKLDLLSAPSSTTLGWTLQTLLNRSRRSIPHATRLQASTLTITATHSPVPVQIDGEIATTPKLPQGLLQPHQSITVHIGNHQVPIISPPPS